MTYQINLDGSIIGSKYEIKPFIAEGTHDAERGPVISKFSGTQLTKI